MTCKMLQGNKEMSWRTARGTRSLVEIKMCRFQGLYCFEESARKICELLSTEERGEWRYMRLQNGR